MILWHTIESADVCRKLGVNPERGLAETEVEKRREKYGENKLEEKKKESIFIKFIKQFQDFMILILIAASIISAAISKIEGTGDYLDSIIIIAIVIFNAIMGLIQENKAERSLEALKKMSAPKAMVKRNGKVINIRSEEVVPGDIVLLEAGSYVPADCRLLKAYHLKIEESALTGETVPVNKDANVILKQDIPIGDRINMAFATTIVVNGHAEAIVTETGMNTKVGNIAKLIITEDAPETPIQKKLEQVGKILGVVCIVICIAIFLIGILKKIPAIQMFMTSIGLAVAAIPEGLPAIVTIMLSIGVTKMARKNAIIRKLPAVETLGSSSVICSDKTGTLTQNKMKVVEIESLGKNKESGWIIELASMCTDCSIEEENKRQTITGDPTEIAIVEEGIKREIDKRNLYQRMKRINDIPFDSTRKLMTTIHQTKEGYRIITKGAPDVLANKCNKYYEDGEIYRLTKEEIDKIQMKNDQMAQKALRVIGVAYLDVKVLPHSIESKTIEKDLIFVRTDWYD